MAGQKFSYLASPPGYQQVELVLELTREQQTQIRRFTGRRMVRLMLTADELRLVAGGVEFVHLQHRLF